jgi:hypothetical protein
MILVLVVWTFLRALLGRSTPLRWRTSLCVINWRSGSDPCVALDFVTATASSGSGSRGCGRAPLPSTCAEPPVPRRLRAAAGVGMRERATRTFSDRYKRLARADHPSTRTRRLGPHVDIFRIRRACLGKVRMRFVTGTVVLDPPLGVENHERKGLTKSMW